MSEIGLGGLQSRSLCLELEIYVHGDPVVDCQGSLPPHCVPHC